MKPELDTTRAKLLAQSQLRRSFDLKPTERQWEQPSLLGKASLYVEPRTEQACDHVGTSREEQRNVWNEVEAICGACGARI